MSVPDPIEPIHFSEPRAVQVRDPENLNSLHSAVNGNIFVYTETKLETDKILEKWAEIMQVAADKAQEFLDEMR